MKIAFYLGSFNPWHDGHDDVLSKALKIFDKVVIMQLSNPGKPAPQSLNNQAVKDIIAALYHEKVEYWDRHNMSAFKAVGNYILGENLDKNQFAMIRGLRNEKDFCEEQILQDIYEDIGLKLPTFFIISDRSLRHYSSTMLKAMNAAADMDQKLDKETFG